MKYQSKRFITLTSLLALIFSAGAMAVPNLISDGGFEDPVICPATGVTFFNGDTLGAWLVGGDSVDLMCTTWVPASGFQSLDLNGLDAGIISQDISTIPGQIYRLTFSLAGDPQGLPVIKTLDVTAGTSPTQSFSFDTTGHTTTDMGWVSKGFFFTASALLTTITFESTTLGSVYGPALDDIAVTERCPPAAITDVNDPNFDIECL